MKSANQANNGPKKKPRKLCCVRHCQSTNMGVVDGKKTSFHEIPCDSKLREIFLNFINRKDEEGNPWIPKQKTGICCWHFDTSCFKDMSNGARRLLTGSVPTKFRGGCPQPSKLNKLRRKRRKAAEKKEQEVQVIPNQDTNTPSKMARTSEPDDLATVTHEAVIMPFEAMPLEEVEEELEFFSESEDECIIKHELTEIVHHLEDLCRLCSEPCVNNCVSVFASRMPIRLASMINFCLPIQVDSKDILPLNICIPCKEKVEEYYKFAVQCKNSEKNMLEMYDVQKLLQPPAVEEIVESTSPSPQIILSPSSATILEPSDIIPDILTVKLEPLITTHIVEISLTEEDSSSKVVENSDIFNCKYCNGIFYDEQKLESHMRSSHREQTKEERKKKKIMIREERKRIKKAVKESKIQLTKKIRKKREVKVKKIRVPRERKVSIPKPTEPAQCNECGKTFRSKWSLRPHLLRHKGEKNFVCHVCGLCFIFNSELNHHSKQHDGRNGPVWCDICNNKFSRRTVLAAHMLSFHLERYRYVCKDCNDFFRSKREIQEHIKQHEGENNTGFKKYYLHRCVVCKIDCQTRYQKQLHFQQKHKDVRLNLKPNMSGHYCKLCFKLFRFRVNFQNHYKKQHPNIPVPMEPQLRTHLKSSLLPYMYNCELCSNKFKFSDNFARHMKKVHATTV